MSEAGPFFSVVTVALNCRDGAVDTACSVHQQKCLDFEYILKDGGSTDGTPGAVREAVPAIIRISADSGIYDAMNQALDLCRGGYVLFLNAGDRLRGPDSLERVKAEIDSAGRPEIVYTHYWNSLRQTEVRYPARLNRFFLFRRSICHQATFVRRDCFERFGGFDTSYRVLADNEMLDRILLRRGGRAHLCPFAAVVYRDGGFSAGKGIRELVPAERSRINSVYFSAWERRLYGVLMVLLLKSFRERMLAGNPRGLVQRAYYRLSNYLNRVAG